MGYIPPPPPPPEPPESDFNILGLYPGLEVLNEKPKPVRSDRIEDLGGDIFTGKWLLYAGLWWAIDVVMVATAIRVLWR